MLPVLMRSIIQRARKTAESLYINLFETSPRLTEKFLRLYITSHHSIYREKEIVKFLEIILFEWKSYQSLHLGTIFKHWQHGSKWTILSYLSISYISFRRGIQAEVHGTELNKCKECVTVVLSCKPDRTHMVPPH